MPPAPAAAPGKPGLDLKRLPPWAWGVALAGGAVIGFVLLKKPPAQGGDEEGGEGGAGAAGAEPGGGAVVVSPIDEALRQALGLSGHDGYTGGGYSGGSGDGGGEAGASSSSSNLISPNESGFYDVRGALPGLTPAQSTAQTQLYQPPSSTPSYTSQIKELFGPRPAPAPAPSSPGTPLFRAQ